MSPEGQTHEGSPMEVQTMLKRSRIALLAISVAALVVLLGASAAFAAGPATPTGATSYHQVVVGKVASILGIDQPKVEAALTQARTEALDQAVQDGRLTQQQADWLKQRMAEGGPGFGFGPGPGAGFGAGSGYGPGMMAGTGSSYGPGFMRGAAGETCPFLGASPVAPTATPTR